MGERKNVVKKFIKSFKEYETHEPECSVKVTSKRGEEPWAFNGDIYLGLSKTIAANMEKNDVRAHSMQYLLRSTFNMMGDKEVVTYEGRPVFERAKEKFKPSTIPPMPKYENGKYVGYSDFEDEEEEEDKDEPVRIKPQEKSVDLKAALDSFDKRFANELFLDEDLDGIAPFPEEDQLSDIEDGMAKVDEEMKNMADEMEYKKNLRKFQFTRKLSDDPENCTDSSSESDSSNKTSGRSVYVNKDESDVKEKSKIEEESDDGWGKNSVVTVKEDDKMDTSKSTLQKPVETGYRFADPIDSPVDETGDCPSEKIESKQTDDTTGDELPASIRVPSNPNFETTYSMIAEGRSPDSGLSKKRGKLHLASEQQPAPSPVKKAPLMTKKRFNLLSQKNSFKIPSRHKKERKFKIGKSLLYKSLRQSHDFTENPLKIDVIRKQLQVIDPSTVEGPIKYLYEMTDLERWENADMIHDKDVSLEDKDDIVHVASVNQRREFRKETKKTTSKFSGSKFQSLVEENEELYQRFYDYFFGSSEPSKNKLMDHQKRFKTERLLWDINGTRKLRESLLEFVKMEHSEFLVFFEAFEMPCSFGQAFKKQAELRHQHAGTDEDNEEGTLGWRDNAFNQVPLKVKGKKLQEDIPVPNKWRSIEKWEYSRKMLAKKIRKEQKAAKRMKKEKEDALQAKLDAAKGIIRPPKVTPKKIPKVTKKISLEEILAWPVEKVLKPIDKETKQAEREPKHAPRDSRDPQKTLEGEMISKTTRRGSKGKPSSNAQVQTASNAYKQEKDLTKDSNSPEWRAQRLEDAADEGEF